jgi:hypothetical protein
MKSTTYGKVVYLDPDIAVFGDLLELSTRLDEYDIVLTPHLCKPENSVQAILDNEICALRHGIYNLGFIAIKRSDNALAFAKWWMDRLVHFCYDDIPQGLFTDQRWCDFVPVFFESVYIEKSCAYNVATWNLSHRTITKDKGKYFVNGKPLQFYHFSGFDSGALKTMASIYGATREVGELIKWHESVQKENDQEQMGEYPCKYSVYSNGEQITDSQRKLMRNRQDLLNHFGNTDPFMVDGSAKCYYSWYQLYGLADEDEKDRIITELKAKLSIVKRYLAPLVWIRRKFLHCKAIRTSRIG